MVPERAGSTLGLSHTLENNRPTMIQNREKTYRKSKLLLFAIILDIGLLEVILKFFFKSWKENQMFQKKAENV